MQSTGKRIGVSTVPSDLKTEREDLERAISITIDLLAINRGTLTLRSGVVTKGRPIRWSIEPKVAAPFVGGTLCQPSPSKNPNYRVSPENKRHFSISSREGTHTHIGFRRTSRTTNDNSGIATALGRRVLIIRCTPFLLKAVVFARVYPAKRFSFSFIIIKSKSHRRTKRTRSGSSALPSSLRSFFDRRGLNERFTNIVLRTRDDDFRCPGWI